MFIGAGIANTWNTPREEILFYEGYGSVERDHRLIAYYRCERVVQDVAEFGKQLLLSEEGGDDREQSLRYFDGQFQPGDAVDMALKTDPDAS
jgi:spectinomycin phosphotransferase